MKIVLYSRPQLLHTKQELNELFGAIERLGLDYCVNDEFADVVSDLTGRYIVANNRYTDICISDAAQSIMISYGGDGTFLESVRKLAGAQVPILGVNSGRLGFLANVPKSEVSSALEQIARGEYFTSARSLLRINGNVPSQIGYPFAFNEFSIQRKGPSMVSVDVYVGGEMVATYWGDGVLLSTPSGSTAYSLSVGGPIVAPNCECFVLSPIAPHNLTMRPVVIPDSSEVEFRVNTRDSEATVTIDNTSFEAQSGDSFRLTKSKKPIFLVSLQNISFYDTLRNKMMWGLDPRIDVK